MKQVKIPVGRSGFADIRENGYYYIDKSGLIQELLKTDATQVILITRPRRFGKTLGMNMLSEFFDIRKDSRALFSGLSVAKDKELCENWMNQYPTLFFSFKDVRGNTATAALGMLRIILANLCNEHFYLKNSALVSENDKKVFLQLADTVDGKPSHEQVETGIALLIRMMHDHYQKPVILLLDEYDVPVAKTNAYRESKTDDTEKIMDSIRTLISTAIKDNCNLKFAVLTGCLKIAKESIFTGTNNFVSDTISHTRLNEYFGFTHQEVDQLLSDTDLKSHAEEIREWYDGYHFGDSDIYCPWDVMNHVNTLLLQPSAHPDSYWKNSSDNAIIRSFIDYSGSTITKKFEILLSGGYIVQKIENNLTYNDLYSSEENLWSILYLTGYLTQVRKDKLDKALPDGCLALIIPNAEIREIFETTVKTWFGETAKQWDRRALFASTWNQDAKTMTLEISRLLRRTISYHDYKEDFYHAFFAGIFAGAGYMVESNREHGEGRSDVIVKDYAQNRAAVFEIKYSESSENLEKDCKKAIVQINDRMYAEDLKEDYATILCYGISFFKKRCLVLPFDH